THNSRPLKNVFEVGEASRFTSVMPLALVRWRAIASVPDRHQHLPADVYHKAREHLAHARCRRQSSTITPAFGPVGCQGQTPPATHCPAPLWVQTITVCHWRLLAG